MKVLQRILVRLLHLANARPPFSRAEFYALKEKLLSKYGRFAGHDLQIIEKQCYGDGWWKDEGGTPCGPTCTRCGGTGLYDVRWHRLERWEWLGYVFHRPVDSTSVRPSGNPASWIRGRIEHANHGRKSDEACLWLYILCGEWNMLWRELKGCYRYGFYAYPLLILQKIVFKVSDKLQRRTCFCGKRFNTWGSGWQSCGSCRRKTIQSAIPF